ncbi:MAG: ABC transporter ATP-binding protein, partial [Chloroflexi bacterium]
GHQASTQGVLFVSHDRAFLDKVATGILEIDQEAHYLKEYAGNYTAYLEQKLAEREKQRQEYSDQQEEVERLKESMRRVQENASFKRGGKGDSGDKFAKGFFANRTKGTIRRAKNLEARIDRLLTDERVEKPRQSWQMKLDFGTVPQGGKDVLVTEGLSVGYGEKVLLEDLDLRIRSGARITLLGENGTGKTTLLRTITGRIPPLAGVLRLGPSIKIGYMTQEQEDLDPDLNAFETIRKAASMPETEARAFLHQFLFSGDDVFTPVGKLSYGERARLSLARLVAAGCNLLLLDEPINHLDIPSRARFESAMGIYEGTILAVVHDRYFIEGFASEIWEVQGRGISNVDMGLVIRDR